MRIAKLYEVKFSRGDFKEEYRRLFEVWFKMREVYDRYVFPKVSFYTIAINTWIIVNKVKNLDELLLGLLKKDCWDVTYYGGVGPGRKEVCVHEETDIAYVLDDAWIFFQTPLVEMPDFEVKLKDRKRAKLIELPWQIEIYPILASKRQLPELWVYVDGIYERPSRYVSASIYLDIKVDKRLVSRLKKVIL